MFSAGESVFWPVVWRGLVARHQGRKVRPDAAKLEARILEWTRRGPQDGTTHWSSRRLAAALGTHHMTVARVWARHGLQPHRLRRYMLSEDPDFEKKAADIIGLYLNPPDHAAVFCVDEKTAIQALDRLDPVLPLSPGRAEAHGFEYYRHGTLSLYAALDTRSGEVLGKTAPRHTSAEFVDFLAQVVASQPRAREIHVIADNLSAHKTTLVDDFLAQHPQVRIHFTPTYSSWLNQVEDLVRQDPKAGDRPGHFLLRGPSPQKNPSLHPALQQNRYPYPMDLLDTCQPNPSVARSSVTLY